MFLILSSELCSEAILTSNDYILHKFQTVFYSRLIKIVVNLVFSVLFDFLASVG